MKIASEGRASILVALALCLGFSFLNIYLAALFGVVGLFLLWFYRDPEREAPNIEGAWVSPADGKVVEIERAYHPFTGEACKVGIFMSPLDVHVNRCPYDGDVAFLEYAPGKKWMAFEPKASELNERFYVGLDTKRGRAMVVQIAGFLARRISSTVNMGERLKRGDRIGMIKLGSKVDLYLPDGVNPVVKVGDRVKAGISIIGEDSFEEKA
ncbi:phosphatidylserine decarboxylase related protein [Thermovirga lienii DSM 17291]|uniref:Phosphatidylserine decarboxylase proenzyme n=1 Tax=Thermovirga lienii (strain ATCC BAA-1197 / DSM 17291 / Cas60314) TaxID=580340 RepID=G7V795_THELD|nr:phosphatidylserine decarboxylase [Thermovirga lienii]AER66129.1 phosphatidylserine decarboxylase related protein [Thermovirga lienii DSM 17291]